MSTFKTNISEKVQYFYDNDEIFVSELAMALLNFFNNDWGSTPAEICKRNEKAVFTGGEILAAYSTSQGMIIIQLKADSDISQVFFPDEYVKKHC